ncbi:MAG TPA: hypothetical protein VM432_08100 [Bdellovibrionales bacterium]|nr:hypothetical protein [Bdellovibrionales bacterium]
MNNEIVLLHRPGSERFDAEMLASMTACFSFETCMRHIALIPADEIGFIADSIREGDQVFRGEEAYRFMLEVICGLHSPLVGETEVYGQMKNAVASFEQAPKTPWMANLKRVFSLLFQDAKAIRQKHLVDLGSQSYGSVLRRELKGAKVLHILGAGHLVQEILPWLAKDGTSIHVHCRDVVKARAALPMSVQIHEIGEKAEIAEGAALIVAAPVSAEWMSGWLEGSGPMRLVADLRSDSHIDRFGDAYGRTLELGEMLTRINENQAIVEQRKSDALELARELSMAKSRHVEYRPFGWEDVCA